MFLLCHPACRSNLPSQAFIGGRSVSARNDAGVVVHLNKIILIRLLSLRTDPQRLLHIPVQGGAELFHIGSHLRLAVILKQVSEQHGRIVVKIRWKRLSYPTIHQVLLVVGHKGIFLFIISVCRSHILAKGQGQRLRFCEFQFFVMGIRLMIYIINPLLGPGGGIIFLIREKHKLPA